MNTVDISNGQPRPPTQWINVNWRRSKMTSYHPSTINYDQLIPGYGEMAHRYVGEGWEPYLTTFMFNQLRGSSQSVHRQMERDVERVYAKSLTRIVRNPTALSAIGKLPVWIVCPDDPVPKHAKQELRDVTVNDGRHAHGLALMPPNSRLNTGLDEHFELCQSHYVRPGYPLRRLHVEPITNCLEHVTDYAFKSLKRRQVDGDHVLILPRVRSEMGTSTVLRRPALPRAAG
jgi:hypothetical protein